MTRIVIDASVVIKLFFEEEHSDAAERCFRKGNELLAPDLLWAETANVLWKRHRSGEITTEAAAEIANHILRLPVQIHAASDLIPDALSIAIQFGRSVYDGLYLALAVKTDCVMASGDRRLVNALSRTEIARHAAWIGDLD